MSQQAVLLRRCACLTEADRDILATVIDEADYSFGQLLERAKAGVTPTPGSIKDGVISNLKKQREEIVRLRVAVNGLPSCKGMVE